MHFGPIRRIIYSFHMPVFFIISGYFFRNKSIKEELKKDFISLIIPYFITCIICTILDYFINNASIRTNFFTSILGIGVSKTILENLTTVGPIWFLICLFFSKIVFLLINKFSKNNKIQFFVCVLLNIMGVLISKILYLPFSFDVVLVTQIYLFIGKYIKENQLFDKKINIFQFIVLLLIWGVGIVIGEFNYVGRSYPYYPISIITSLVASYTFIIICKWISENNIFTNISKIIGFYGKNSLYILCVHRIEKDFINYNFFINTSTKIIDYLLIFIVKMIIITICTEIILLIKKYINSKKENVIQ